MAAVAQELAERVRLAVFHRDRVLTIELARCDVDVNFESVDVTTLADPARREIRTGWVEVDIRGCSLESGKQVPFGPRFDYHASADFLQENGFPEHVVAMLHALGGPVEVERQP